MQDIAVFVLLMAAAVLGCFGFTDLFARKQNVTTWEKVTTTVGVTAFLSAVGFVLEHNWIAAAALLLLLTWLVYDTAERRGPSRRLLTVCAWLGLALLFVYIGLARC